MHNYISDSIIHYTSPKERSLPQSVLDFSGHTQACLVEPQKRRISVPCLRRRKARESVPEVLRPHLALPHVRRDGRIKA